MHAHTQNLTPTRTHYIGRAKAIVSIAIACMPSERAPQYLASGVIHLYRYAKSVGINNTAGSGICVFLCLQDMKPIIKTKTPLFPLYVRSQATELQTQTQP